MRECNVNPRFADIVKDPWLLLAFGFGSGLSKIVPGTAGTLVAVPLYCLVATQSLLIYSVFLVATTALGVYLCTHASNKLGVHDHTGIVWDEFVGFWITMYAVPFQWYWVLVGFVLFRLFDMVKPWPISLADRKVNGGFGIMFDDILAGIAAWASLHGIIFYFGS